jgi:hypothetical protein
LDDGLIGIWSVFTASLALCLQSIALSGFWVCLFLGVTPVELTQDAGMILG